MSCNLLTQILKGVLKVHITDGDDDGVLILAPVKAALLQPLKIRRVLHLLAHEILCKLFSLPDAMADGIELCSTVNLKGNLSAIG